MSGKIRRFKRYPAYKDSGIEWLGKIPTEWHISKMWDLTAATSGGTPAKEEPRYWNGDIPWVSPKDMKRRFIESSEDTVTQAALDEVGLKLVNERSVLIVVRGMILAHSFPVAITRVPVTINQDMKALWMRQDVDPDFFAYWLTGAASNLLKLIVDEAAHGTKAIRMDRWRVTPVTLPPYSEQRGIATFLDQETARIDALVAKKERLIELLQEKRSALITRAVTKGLDTNVPMKDSGVEWLGEIPAHWSVRRIAMAVDKITNGFVGPTRDIFVNDGTRYLQSLHIKKGAVDFERKPYYVSDEWSRAHSKSVLREGEVLVVQTGDIGQVCSVPADFAGSNCHALIILRLKPRLGSGGFLSLLLQSDYGQNALKWSQTGALHPHLECGHVREIPIVVPPPDEQAVIVEYVEERALEIDRLLNTIRNAIHKITELRAALISATVTGKIDVREEVA